MTTRFLRVAFTAMSTPQAHRGESPATGGTVDPVVARRAVIARWTLLANRVGYLFMAVAMCAFVMAFAFGFKGPLVTSVLVCLGAGSVLLAPSIVLGHAVKAAEREDREKGL